MGHDPQLREFDSPRLDSWKEIASFLHRDARTVRRWERERRLPVHRVPGGERSGVFAYVNELERWLHASAPSEEVSEEATSVLAPEDTTVIEEPSDSKDLEISQPVVDSAFQALNSSETSFAVENADQNEFAAVPNHASAFFRVSSHVRKYQALALLVMLSAGLGISAAVVHYREARHLKTIAHVPNSEAQELYLRGRYSWNLRTEEGLNCAVDLFTQAIVHDPHYAAAYAGLADAYLLLRQYGHMPDSEAYPRALAAAKQAIALDDDSPEAHRSIAFILRFWNWDMVAAEKEYLRAIELNPNDSLSHHWYATALLSSNRYAEAMTQIDIARKLEPQSVSVFADRGLILSMTDIPAGVMALKQVEDAQPSFLSTHVYLASTYLKMEDYEGFLAESTIAAELSHDAAVLAVLKSAQKILDTRGPKPMLRQIAGDFAPLAYRNTVAAYDTARLFALAGEPDQAMRYLRLACDRREPGFLNVEDDRAFTALRSSVDYNTLTSRRGVPTGNRQPIARLDTPELSE